jgi:hypothetical protein
MIGCARDVAAKTAAALVALIAIPVVALSFRGPLLSLARNSADIISSRARAAFVFRVATVPHWRRPCSSFRSEYPAIELR